MAIPTDAQMGHRDRLTNEQVQTSIVQRLEASPHHELRHVHADVSEQQIVLTGTVATYFMKQLAQETARQACATRKVVNDVKVS
jgi:osmotically-inducible protein OsmY